MRTDVSRISDIKDDTAEIRNTFMKMSLDTDVKELRSWLSATDSTSNHHRAREQRQADTGLWFVHGEDFAHWKDDQASFLWLHGIPGCGKTVLRYVQNAASWHHSVHQLCTPPALSLLRERAD